MTGGDTHHYTNEDTFGEFFVSVENGVLASGGPFSPVVCPGSDPGKRAHHQRVRLAVPNPMVGPTVPCDLQFWSYGQKTKVKCHSCLSAFLLEFIPLFVAISRRYHVLMNSNILSIPFLRNSDMNFFSSSFLRNSDMMNFFSSSFLRNYNVHKFHSCGRLPCIGRESNPGLPRGRREFYH